MTNIANTKLELVTGDITAESTDAIVNAANATLAGGGGVDGAIHRVGGPSIMEACDVIRAKAGGCPPGSAVVTTAGDLDAKAVIHTVGPIWKGGIDGEFVTLEKAYEASLDLAAKENLRSIAFPSISTGAYGFPVARAAQVALGTVIRWLGANPDAVDRVRFVLFSEADHASYQRELDDHIATKMG